LVTARQRRLGQNFLADSNLLAAMVDDSGAGPESVVLEVGGGEGALSERLAARAGFLHVVELDGRLREALEELAREHSNLRLAFGDAMRIDLGALDPAPNMVVSNLPYSIATPLLLRTIAELPLVSSWTVMVQREIAVRLRAEPGGRMYGAPSVLVQLACEVELLRSVNRAVFVPRPRVDSALLHLTRIAPAAAAETVALVRAAFAHRRKTLARSLELAGVAAREPAHAALAEVGLPRDVRAQALSASEFERLAAELATHSG
jgi:16S rRNA (adenine1518-N6/adenine1519-N6)-dimethyltransferase